MACKTWQESDEGACEFMESATEEQAREGLYELLGLARRYAGVSTVTANRLNGLADLVWKLGCEKFGPDFDIPF